MPGIGFCCQGTSLDAYVFDKILNDGFSATIEYVASPLSAGDFCRLLNGMTNRVGNMSNIQDINTMPWDYDDTTLFSNDNKYTITYYQITNWASYEDEDSHRYIFDNIPWKDATIIINTALEYAGPLSKLVSGGEIDKIIHCCDYVSAVNVIIPSISIKPVSEKNIYIPCPELVAASLMSKMVYDCGYSDLNIMIECYQSNYAEMMDGAVDQDFHLKRAPNNLIDNYNPYMMKCIGKVVPELNGKVFGHCYSVPGQNSGLISVTVQSTKDMATFAADIKAHLIDNVVTFSDEPTSTLTELQSDLIKVWLDTATILTENYVRIFASYNPLEIWSKQIYLLLKAL